MTTNTNTDTDTDNAGLDSSNSVGPQSQSAISVYQQLRGHLAVLKLDAAAEALPQVLAAASEHEWSMTQTLEHLLGIEVDATDGFDGVLAVAEDLAQRAQ